MRRFLTSEAGPVPVTANMPPEEQEIIRAGNAGVLQALQTPTPTKKRASKQFKWSVSDRFRLGRMAAQTKGMSSALVEARKVNPAANESTLRNFAKQYKAELSKNPRIAEHTRGKLVHKKRGKPVKFGRHDADIVHYIRAIRRQGGRINKLVVVGTATGILTRQAPHLLRTAAGNTTITKSWVRSLYTRLRFKKRKATKAARKVPENSAELGDVFFNRIYDIKTKYNIPPSMIIVYDEHSSSLFPVSEWTMEEEGARQVPLIGKEDKRCMTVGTAFSGPPFNMLKSQFIYEGKTNQCHPDVDWPPTVDVTHSESHWSTESTICRIIDNSFHEYLQEQRAALMLRDDQFGLLLWDVFRSHTTRRVLDLLEARYIKVCFTPAGCTGLYAPPDHPEWHNNVKGSNKDKCSTWYAGEVTKCVEQNIPLKVDLTTTVLKPMHARWTLETLAYAATQKTWMENAWKGTGLLAILDGTFIPNPQLSTMYVPPPLLTAEEAENGEPPSDEGSYYTTGSERGDISAGESDDEQQRVYYEQTLVDEEEDVDSDETTIDVPAAPRTQQSDGRAEEKLHACNSQLPTPPPTSVRRPHSPAPNVVEDMHLRIAMAASLKQAQPLPQFEPDDLLQEVDNEGIAEEETRCSRELVQQQQWKINFVDEPWQLAKKLLFDESERPKSLRKHTYIQSMIVQPSVVPRKIHKIPMDGACFFSCISFAIFRDVTHAGLVRDYVCDNVGKQWGKGKVKLLAAMFYQKETKKQLNVRPSLVDLDARTYLEVSKMRTPTIWAGSTEIEVAAHWLQTPIKVFHLGNPLFPANSWTTYGPDYVSYDCRTILLEWANRNHYNFIVSI